MIPPQPINLTPRSAPLKAYYERRQQIAAQDVHHEMAIREAFKILLEKADAGN